MANYKNNKPKSYKGCCGLCCLYDTDGRRNGRRHTIQEERFYMNADEEERDYLRLREEEFYDDYLEEAAEKAAV
jgi:hypothetical protein